MPWLPHSKIHHWHQHCTWLGRWSDDCFAQSNNPNPRHDSPIMTLVKYTKQTLVNKNNGNRKDMIKCTNSINAFSTHEMDFADWSPTMALSFADTRPDMCAKSKAQRDKPIACFCSLLPSKQHGVQTSWPWLVRLEWRGLRDLGVSLGLRAHQLMPAHHFLLLLQELSACCISLLINCCFKSCLLSSTTVV